MEKNTKANKELLSIFPNTNAINGFESIYNRYVDKVYQKCLSMTKDSDSAKDFTHDIFIKVFEKLETFQNRSTLSTWLYSISHHYCLDQLRLNKRRATVALSDIMVSEVGEDQSESVDSQLNKMAVVMDSLPTEEIALLRLKHEQGLSIKELAQVYYLSESAVKMRLKRTRHKLMLLYANCDY